MTTDGTPIQVTCPTPQGLGQKHILADFSGGAVTSNGGALLLGLADASLDLTRRLGQCFDDHRDPALVVHEVQSLVGQRIVGLALGYEDLNDHEELRKDPVVGAILGCLEPRRSDCEPLAGKSTLNRLELAAAGVNHQKQRKLAANFEQMDELLVKLLVEDYAAPPPQIVLDVDTTDYVVHGSQQQRFYHGYYREYCYLPLLVFCGTAPVLVRLRSADGDAAGEVEQDLDRLVDRIREFWPHTRIVIRADSGFCRDPILAWCEGKENLDYVIGLSRNQRLTRAIESELAQARATVQESGAAARRFCEFSYQTLKSWTRPRRVIAKAEVLPANAEDAAAKMKDNPRFIVTSLPHTTHAAVALYESFYCARGDAENRVKEQKLDLFGDRCSSNLFDANTLRLYLTTFTHVLMNRLRRALAGTPLARATPNTVRLRLLKIGARVRVSVRRIHVAMAGGCPDKETFANAWRVLAVP